MTKKNLEGAEVIAAMMDRLPPIGSVWPLADRCRWLTAMEAILEMVYGRGDAIELPDILSSAEPTDEAMARDDVEGSGSPSASAAGDEDHQDHVEGGVGSERSSSAETNQEKPVRPGPRAESSPRPDGIPTTFSMFQTVLKEKPGLLAAGLIDEIRERWWPGLGRTFLSPEISSHITNGRLTRDLDGRLFLTEHGRNLGSTDNRPEIQKGKKPTKLPSVPQRTAPLVAPRAAAAQGIKFEHGERSTTLPDMRSYVIAGKLRAAMGKGHISEAFLAEQIIGSNTEAHRETIKLSVRSMADQLAEVGLKVEFYPGFGFMMKEVEA